MARTGSSGPEVQHASQRHQIILRKLRSEGQLRALDVAHELGVTHETVRKDLLQLEGRGLLKRVHGGALPIETLSYEPSVASQNHTGGGEAADRCRGCRSRAGRGSDPHRCRFDHGSPRRELSDRPPR